MAKYVGRVVDGVLLWFGSPSRLDQQKHDPHSSCGSCNKKYKQKKGKKYCSRACKEIAHKKRNKVKKKSSSLSVVREVKKAIEASSATMRSPRLRLSVVREVKKALEEVSKSPLGQALSSVKAMPVVIKEPVKGNKTRACKGCSKRFTPPTGQGRYKLFCTVKCRAKVRNKKASEKILQKKREIRAQPRECQNCTKSFKVENPNGPLPKFCSAVCRVEHHLPPANKKTATKKEPPKKTFVERVAEHLPTPTLPVVEPVKDQPASKVVVPTWTALVEEAKELGVSLDKEPRKSQSFYIALLMARRAHHYKEWKELLSTQDCRIRQLPETFSALKSVSGTSAFAAAKALKVSMNM
jgi:predicted nucleic acid-binding Zn ribbon protein